MTLGELHALKEWHQRHWRRQPLEKDAWDLILTLWLAGCVGMPVSVLVHAGWGLVACGALLFLPTAYVQVRRRLHVAGLLRCDWIATLRSPFR
jgi:hypothetical protein